MPIVVESAPGAGVAEGFILDGLDLNTLTGTFTATALDFTPAKKRPEWAEAVDGDGALLIRDPYFDNSQWDCTIEIRAATRDAAHTAVGQITDKLEEAERNPLGIPLVWTPANSTKALTFYVLTGEITEIPITIESGYFSTPPTLAVNLMLVCRPFGYGAEVTVPAASGAGPLQIFLIANVTGDVAAEGRLIITDTASQNRSYVAWGLEQRFQAAADLVLTQPDLTATGFSGTSATRSGSLSTNIFRGTLATSPLVVCGTGNQPHIGTYRVFGRFWASGTGVRVRLAAKDGDGPLKALEWETPPVEDAWVEIDLGVVSITQKLLGTQRWQGQIEAYSTTGGDTIDVDYLLLVPAGEGFAKVSVGSTPATPTTVIHRDEFDQTAGAMTGKTAPVGGVYTGAGDVDDFNASGSGTATRSAVSDADASTGRYLLSGASSLTNTLAQMDFSRAIAPGSTGDILQSGVLVRYVDTSNWLKLVVQQIMVDAFTAAHTVQLVKRVAGTVTTIASAAWTPLDSFNDRGSLKLLALASGRFFAYDGATSTSFALRFAGVDSDLATGGVLASGKVGMYDVRTSSGIATTRSYDNLIASPITEDAVIFSGRSIEFRWDTTQRYDATGVYAGEVVPRGASFFVPPAGDENRSSRVAVLARRSNIDEIAEANVTDNQSVEVRYIPRYLYLPR